MKSFFKFFLASLLALFVFTLLGIVILIGIVTMVSGSEKVTIGSNSVLVLDLSNTFSDRKRDNTFARLAGEENNHSTSLYEVIRLIQHAKKDSLIKGIYVKCNDNGNGFAASEELRRALLDFRESRKFIIAYGEVMSQKAYYVGSAADKIYCNPKGMLDWKGFSSQLFFIKNTLKKLEIEPQIFYDGKFKSATEPLREEKMTEANRLQTTVWLGDLYNRFLLAVAESRKTDTATLHKYASDLLIQTTGDAVRYNLIDGVKYDDEVKEEIRNRLGIGKSDKIAFVFPGSYAEKVDLIKYHSDRIAVIYAEGDIVDGKGNERQVGSGEFRNLLAKARDDKNIKAVVLRVNSPGGSALASEIIWRETMLIKEAGKPLIVSMGDVAASGGYYISCAADTIFAEPNTITGSIGVFGIVPNMKTFFNNTLGVTFDEVKTAPSADIGSITRPLTDVEKKVIQAGVDTIYSTFKKRVADGRTISFQMVDSLAQGRVWAGSRAQQTGLVDRLGSLDDAIVCAARMANLSDYGIREYPEPKSFLDMLKGNLGKNIKARVIKNELGNELYPLYQQLQHTREMIGTVQARLPYEIVVE